MTKLAWVIAAILPFLAGCSTDVSEPLAVSAQEKRAQVIYEESCAGCHDGQVAGAPGREVLEGMTPGAIVAALTSGVMKEQGASLDRVDLYLLSEFLGIDKAASDEKLVMCQGSLPDRAEILWNNWGSNPRNSRLQPAAKAGLTVSDIPKLELAWAFGFPGAQRARSQPAVTEKAIYTGSQSGRVYALDPDSGCVWWTYDAAVEVRNAPLLSSGKGNAPDVLYFGDFGATVYALNAATGEEIWTQAVKDHPDGTITGSFTLHDGKLYVPMSSTEIISAYLDDYDCCTFRGGVTALDAATGKRVWRWYSTDEPAGVGTTSAGARHLAPSGAPVWSTPTVDAKRGLLYVGTGENYSSPANNKSDAIIALDLVTGRERWVMQATSGDAWNAACGRTSRPNCPTEDGPDFDFGAPPMLVTLANGKDMILAGQKSGEVFGIDPDRKGAVVWRRRVGMGGFNGGIHWGMASDGKALWVGIADTPGNRFAEGPPRPGIHALDPATGRLVWSRIEPPTCDEASYACMTALSAPLTAIPGAIFAGAHNGRLLAYSSTDGSILWKQETNRKFATVNGVKAKGGTIDGAGVVIAGGMVMVNSGYDKFGEIPGNVLLVYRVKGAKR